MYYKYSSAASTPMNGFMVPKRFFVTSGVATGAASELNAFDLALDDAGISGCNLVPVSSILPTEAEYIEPLQIPKGAITFCVMAKMAAEEGTRVGAGLAWAWGTDAEGDRYGIVAEHHGSELPSEIELIVKGDLLGMAEARQMAIERVNSRVESTLCMDGFGSAVAVLVYAP
jgi:pyruvoyl-dependent arginine decarboxylase